MTAYNSKQVFITITAYVGQLLVGFLLGWSAPTVPRLQDPELTHLPDVINDGQASWMGSIAYLGLLLSPLVTGWVPDKYGRKPCMFIGGLTFLVAYIFQAASVNYAMMFIARFITGFGAAIIVIINMVYLGEIVSTDIRGMVLTGTSLSTNLGVIIIYSAVPFMANLPFSLMVLAVTIVYLAGLFFIPESPMFNAISGDEDKAVETLKRLGRTDIKDVVLAAKDKQAGKDKTAEWKELFQLRSNRKALFIVVTLNILQQLSGAIVVTLFSTTIFQAAGSTIHPDIATIIIGFTQLVGAFVTPLFVDRIGRKILLMVSCGICSLCLTVLGTYFYLDDVGHDMTVVGWLPLVCLTIFFLSYNGLNVIPLALIGEMFSSGARSTGTTVTISAGWVVGFILATVFGYIMAAIGAHYIFWMFAAFCIITLLFSAIFVIETKGKTFTEIQEILNR